MSRPVHWTLAPHATGAYEEGRRVAARALQKASIALAKAARRMRAADRGGLHAEAMFEFSAEAGAPEGALYVDGYRVGVLEGVTRL
jgi:hypothetical protein